MATNRRRMRLPGKIRPGNLLTEWALGRYDAAGCPGATVSLTIGQRTCADVALSGEWSPGRVVLGVLGFLGQAVGWGRDG